jgi:hypothetical protein
MGEFFTHGFDTEPSNATSLANARPLADTRLLDALLAVRRPAGCALFMAAALASSSCFLGHKQHTRVFIPPQPPAAEPAKETPPDLPAPPAVAASAKATDAPEVPSTVVIAPPPPAPPKRPPTPPPKVQATAPITPEPPAPAVAPRLGQIFTPGQLKEYNRSLQESFARVDKALARLNGKRLTPEQAETADRIRTFRKQAEQAREQDLVTAVSLAKRADLLAKDLIERLP